MTVVQIMISRGSGIYQAKVMAETGKSFVVFDRYHKIGGVWEFYGNDSSRVNTSEMLAF